MKHRSTMGNLPFVEKGEVKYDFDDYVNSLAALDWAMPAVKGRTPAGNSMISMWSE